MISKNSRIKLFISRVFDNVDKRKFFSVSRVIEGMKDMPDFPSSACTSDQYLDLTLSGATNTYNLILETAKVEKIRTTNIEDYCSTHDQHFTEKVAQLLNEHGSDKASHHNYHYLYSKIFKSRVGIDTNILEIGLGTNNTDVPSNMGYTGKPGASLRAWAELDKHFQVFGADIDQRVLFNEDRISTFQLDQIDRNSWKRFTEVLPNISFDIIIDDGLHSPEANLNSILHLVPMVRPGGVIIVEDIAIRALPVWTLLEKIAPKNLNFEMISAKRCFILLITVS